MNIHGIELVEAGDMVVKTFMDNGGRFEDGSIAVWREIAKQKGTMLDIGAYSGLFSMIAAKEGASVHAFEPNDKIFSKLCENMKNNGLEYSANNIAIGDTIGHVGINRRFDTSSAAHIVEGNKVEIKTVDSFEFDNVTAMKIDVEGYELKVLNGALETIKKYKPLIITEVLTNVALDEQTEFFEGLGYTGEKIDSHNRIWRAGTAADYWKNEGLLNIIPNDTENPEGFNIQAFVSTLFDDGEKVTDFGCGVGRLTSAFKPENYYGYDINDKALEIAREQNKGFEYGNTVKYLDSVLFYTVLLHIPDDEIDKLISSIESDKVVVAEIMGREWRRDGTPPVFNREISDYIEIFESAGFELVQIKNRRYKHYDETDISFLTFIR